MSTPAGARTWWTGSRASSTWPTSCATTTSASTGAATPTAWSAEDTPLESRILAVADAYVAMNEDRPYRAALSRRAWPRELRLGRARQFDPVVLDALDHAGV